MNVEEPVTLRRCPTHHVYFPEEDQMRPMEEFRRDKSGRIQPTYCRRCTSKQHTAYNQKRRTHEATDLETSLMKTFLSDLQHSVEALSAQIETPTDEAQLRKLSKTFGVSAAEKVLPLLQHVAEQRQSLPPVVHDQRNTVVE